MASRLWGENKRLWKCENVVISREGESTEDLGVEGTIILE
jgi:hypothetical protein